MKKRKNSKTMRNFSEMRKFREEKSRENHKRNSLLRDIKAKFREKSEILAFFACK